MKKRPALPVLRASHSPKWRIPLSPAGLGRLRPALPVLRASHNPKWRIPLSPAGLGCLRPALPVLRASHNPKWRIPLSPAGLGCLRPALLGCLRPALLGCLRPALLGCLRPALLGLAILALLVKPQAGGLLALYFLWRLWRERGWRGVAAAGLSAGGVLAASLLACGWWPAHWWHTLTTFGFTERYWNAAIWPWGLLALPFLALPVRDGQGRLRVILAVSLLAAPYVTVYHATALLVLVRSPLPVLTLLLVWAMPFTGFRIYQLIPLAVLAAEVVPLLRGAFGRLRLPGGYRDRP